jgi:hypothetical protein
MDQAKLLELSERVAQAVARHVAAVRRVTELERLRNSAHNEVVDAREEFHKVEKELLLFLGGDVGAAEIPQGQQRH